ncbi:FAD-dependent oxidoreductase, partial [Turicimonas muris]
MSKLSRRSFLGSTAAGLLTSIALPSAVHAADAAPQKWDQTADLLVIGAGGAGLATAVSASQNGVKNILILEKMPFVGGNTSISGGGFNSVDPVRQKKQNIQDSP